MQAKSLITENDKKWHWLWIGLWVFQKIVEFNRDKVASVWNGLLFKKQLMKKDWCVDFPRLFHQSY